MTKISVVTISFNQGCFLEDCIRSVLNQSYPDTEYIIVDPGSTDGSRGIIQHYSDRISRIIFEPDNGPADGLNKGFRYATGDILCYLNSDDILLPGAFQTVVKHFLKNPDIDVICGNGYQLNTEGEVVKKIFSTSWNAKAYAYGACNIVQQATFFRHSAFKRTTGFNSNNKTCWDGELLVDLALAGATFRSISEFLGGFRIHSESITGKGPSPQYKLDSKRISQKILGSSSCFSDRILRQSYRCLKYVKYPFITMYKILNALRLKS